jgi:hypothetical protein
MPRTVHRTDRRRFGRLTLALLPAALAITVPVPAGAAPAPVSSTWRGVAPTAYDHTTGGGHWSDGRPSLVPFALAWTCDDVVSYLLRLDARGGIPTASARAGVSMTSDSTGRSGIALVPIPGGVSIDASDPAHSGVLDSTITDVTTSTAGSPLSAGATSSVGFTVTNLGASDTVVVRVDLRLVCSDPTAATGTVQARLATVTDLGGTVSYLAGAQTVPARGARLRGATTSTTAPAVTTTTAPTVSTTAPPVTTTTAPDGVPGSSSATTSTTAPGATSTTLATEVLGEQAENTSGLGARLAETGGSLVLVLLGLGACLTGIWFVTGARRRPAAGD